MKILKNRHMMTAALVAPLLALMSYYAVDYFVGEKPFAAKAGQSYQLLEKPNCRYASGSCGLKNGEFELTLVPEWNDANRLRLTLHSEFPLDGVVIAAVVGGLNESSPKEMLSEGERGKTWTLELRDPDLEHDRLRIVAASNQSLWYGDVALKFALPAEAR